MKTTFASFSHAPRTASKLILAALLAGNNAPCNTYVVTTTAPAGPGSLEEAISLANANPGPDVIVFNLLAFPATIMPNPPGLPDITDSLFIDATPPPNCTASVVPRIALDGSLAGLNANGLTALGPATGPISVTIRGLAIHSFSGRGIRLSLNANSVIVGNYLGTDLGGILPKPNAVGLEIENCTNVLVGGSQPCERNIISGNQGDGVVISGGTGSRVLGNWVGLTANGMWPLPNGVGVTLAFCTGGQLGSLSLGEGNVISRNQQAGVQVIGGLGVPQQNLIEGNFIGTLPDGASPAGNNGAGVYFFGGPTKNFVRGNVIAWNGASGVSLLEGIDNTIAENSIFNNLGLGIDISPVGGPNFNDACDLDAGPNRQQNFPILAAGGALNFGTSLQVDGSLDSEGGKTYRLDFYWSPTCDPFGFGEGKHYIGQTTVSIPPSGCVGNFSASFPAALPKVCVITATATHPEGSTSEFSQCFTPVYLGTNFITHSGLPHTPQGGASVTETNGWLEVGLQTGGGSNGVRVALGRAEGWSAEVDSFQLLPGDSFQMNVLRDSCALNPQPQPPQEVQLAVASLSLGSNSLTFRGNFTPGGSNLPMNLRLEFHDAAGNLLSTVRFPNGGQYDLPPCTNIYQDIVVCSNAYVSLHSGEPAFCWRFCHQVCIPPYMPSPPPYFPPERLASSACLVAEAPWRWTNGCIVCPRLDVGTNQTAGTIELTAQLGAGHAGGVPLRLGTEGVQQFGQFHQTVGGAQLTAFTQRGGPTALNVNLPTVPGGSGTGGASLRLDRSRYIDLVLDPTSSGTAAPWWFGLHVGTNHVTDNTRVQVSSNVADITFDFTASGTSTGRLDFFARGVLVGSLNAITDTVVNATSPPVRVAAATSPFTPAGAPGFGLYWPEAVGFILVMTPGGPQQQFTADELRITPLNPTRPLLWLAHLDVEAEGIPGFEILAEAERPAVPGPLSIQTSGNTLRLSYPTEPGRPYQIDATSSLSPSAWQPFDAFLGDGLLRQVVVPPGGGSIRFFRLGAQ